jgi:hypothetical protein
MAIGIGLVYDPRGHTFESWSALMVEAYASQQLQMNVSEENWNSFASGMMAIDIFQNDGIPNPSMFSKWNEWAEAVVNVVNQPR